MLISETQAYGKYIQPVHSAKHVKSQISTMNPDISPKTKKNNVSFADVLDHQMIQDTPQSNRNATNMEITNLYNVLDSNNSTKIDSLAKKYAQLLLTNTNDTNSNAKKDVANFVLSSQTNRNHENMMFMKNLVETHYLAYTTHTNTITEHHLGYCDPNDYTILYAVLSGIRRKNLGY